MKKWVRTIFALFLFLTFVPKVSAQENKINSIHMAIELHEDGSATIHETRKMETYEHTELYIVLENLGDTELVDFSVRGFTENPNWDIDASFNLKSNRYGVIDTDSGYELAWGISEYGTPTYEVEYTLSNIVRNLEDGQALFWNFDSFLSLPTEQLTLEISAPFPLEDKVQDFFGFGFVGPISVSNGTLNWAGTDLDESNDVIALLQFPEGTFNASSSMDMTLAEQREMATEGSSYNEEGPWPLWLKIIFVAGISAGVGGVGLSIWTVRNILNAHKKHDHFKPGDYVKENKDKISPIPPKLEGEIGRYNGFITPTIMGGGGFSNYFMAYLLSWTLEERIIIETREIERRFFGPKTEADIYIQNYDQETAANQLAFEEYVSLFEMGESTLEEVFWSILLETADSDGRIVGDAIEEWAKENGKEISELNKEMTEVSDKWLVENGYMNMFEEKSTFGKIPIKQLTDKGKTFVTELVQFHHFIKEIKEADLQEFDDWPDLIVWAALLGHAEETIKQLEEFHPNSWAFVTNTYPYVYGRYRGYHYFHTSSATGLTRSGYGSSGGGGMSSGGGGGGAGGGGGGGSR